MPKSIQLIWDFYGPDALQTAKHHAIHLKEYFDKEAHSFQKSDAELVTEDHAIGFIICAEKEVHLVKNQLKPHRALIL
ncbi:hypothetical protein DNU06_08605 [Putridiphycobacter roseus]|uniref:Uncharacterized protein n=1 Tax=Putridiphycobacter roseus TaxID=2219161 RepID=A0A2W1N2V1_9FLAO|nr:hypothetical protein [Putridiphycobacter roseus]PZE17321.1 hypothetical protein DNU06_08605 [Putridiphycobacter roseus]